LLSFPFALALNIAMTIIIPQIINIVASTMLLFF
jgi:hypothetical protein